MSDTEFSTLAWATPVRPLVGKADHAVWAGETPVEQIRASSWAYWRQRGRTASVAIACMREDVAAGTVRFPRHHPDANPTHSAYGEGLRAGRSGTVWRPGLAGNRTILTAGVMDTPMAEIDRPRAEHIVPIALARWRDRD